MSGALFLYYILQFFIYTQVLLHQCLLFGEGSMSQHTMPGPLNRVFGNSCYIRAKDWLKDTFTAHS